MKTMKSWKTILLTGVLALGLLALSGCGDDPVAPKETYEVDAATAEQWSLQAVDMISQMAAAVPPVAEGDFSTLNQNKNAGEPVWDEEQMAWVLDQTMTFTEGDPPTSTGETRMSIWIQFRGPEGPLPAALGATEMEFRESAGMTMHSDNEQGVSDLDFDLATGMVVAFLDNGYGMTGTGQALINASTTAEGRTQRMNLAMSWGLDLVAPLEGCPLGTAFVQVGQYRTEVVYDGEGSAAWTLTGPSYSASGTETVPCGAPM